MSGHTHTGRLRCTVQVHQAQNGRNSWVRDLSPLPGVIPVTVGRRVCAELLASLMREWMYDRIDNGSSPMYGPW